jgi:hypothetical protein
MARQQTQGANEMTKHIPQNIKDEIIYQINYTNLSLSGAIRKFGLTISQLKTIRQEYANTLRAYQK